MSNQPITIAIADDHTMMRKGLISIINNFENFQVTVEASDGLDFLEKLASLKTLPDVCLLDVSMPRKNGYETMKDIKLKWPYMKVLVLSMYSADYTILQMLKLGAKGFLSKNFTDPSDLKNALTSVYTKGFYMSETVDRTALKAFNTNNKNIPRITDPEMTFLKYSCSEYSYEEIAGLMNVSKRTVEGYRDSLFKKFFVKTRNALTMFALKNGIVAFDDLKLESD